MSFCHWESRRRFRDDKKIEIERFSLTSSKPFDQVVAALNTAIGHPDMAEFGRSTHEARSFAQLKSAGEKGLSKAGLMLFMQLDRTKSLLEIMRQRVCTRACVPMKGRRSPRRPAVSRPKKGEPYG
jgi:hypothetical protein